MRGGVDGIGNPGMVCARAFDGRGRSTFTLGAEDASAIETRAPPKGTRFFSIVACACSRGGRVMRSQAG